MMVTRATGPVLLAPLEFAGYTVPDQAFSECRCMATPVLYS